MAPRRISLGTFPTPVEPLPRLAAAVGLQPDDLWIKRDDLTGLGGGGNKIRKLEWTVGAALAEGADTLVTTGAPQSNHARLTAAAAARSGLDAVLVFPAFPGTSHSGNLVLDGLMGAHVVWAGNVDASHLAREAAAVTEQLRRQGKRPALIPFGGSSTLAARGYLRCAEELKAQVPHLRHTVVALGSGGTMAGLVAGLGAHRVLGVDTGALAEVAAAVREFAAPLSPTSATDLTADMLRICHDHIGEGYGAFTDEVAAALSLAARTEGLILDPTYTGRAMAGLVSAVRSADIKPGEKTVFIHTGGLPGLFGHPDAVRFAEERVTAHQRPASP
ncbi:D-cysteine desulfhydrase family protein [Streptomyces carpinensis]|uniref:D-cysteine desulfhydrase family protein n=1 Tax=Streptomyces carpinensis TaxID=66369 RepID=A0ABV1VW59_9ACTN|nr:D-cysteine desulfhydrase family protein [Streptomyces carpinensis]